MRKLRLLLFLLLLPALAQGVNLTGRVTDEKGQGLPYASIYIKESAIGSSTNESGYYQLQLKPGTYTIEFKYVGYKTNVQTVTIEDQAQQLNVTLTPEVLHLNEVEVRATDEDPAYAIMRNAIRLRKYHLNEVNAWSARVYMKSLGRMEKVPSKILGVRIVDVDTGIVYLSESVSELHFKKPNKINERMISSKVSGQKRGFSFNQASEMNISIYENLLKVEGLSERGFISPLANNAFFYYRFEYHGSFQENGRSIYKIKVIPRRKNDPVFDGFIYIVDGSWRVHSMDLRLTKNAGIDFVDFIRVQQVYAPVQDDVWMPVTQKFNFEASGLGFKGRGHVTGVYSRYKVQPAYSRPPVLEEPEPEPTPVATAETPRRTRRQQPVLIKPEVATPEEQQPIHSENLFSKEILKVEKDANKRDSAYWAEIRPIPLTEEEALDYEKKDSLEVIKESREYKDSLDRIRNKPTFGNFFIRGYTYSNTFKNYRVTVNPLVGLTGGNGIVQYNTVEGWVTDVRLRFRNTLEDRRRYDIEPTIRYGFGNQKLNAKLRVGYFFDRFNNSVASVEGGRYVEDINNLNPIAPLYNTLSTLLYERNWQKLYQRDYARVNYAMDVVQSLRLNTYVDYSHRMPLQNTSSFKLRDLEERAFTSNVPFNEELPDAAAFSTHQALTLYAALSWRPGQKYISLPDRKINLPSKWPTFTVAYRGAVPGVLGSDVKYNMGIAQISDNRSFGLFGTSDYSLTAGTFWGKGNMTLLDFKHFNGNRVVFAGVYQGFQLLDYYRYSTQNSYIEGHFEHHFNGFVFNKVPLFRRLKWQEVVSVNYLNTRESQNYLELGLGVEHIFKFLRVDFFSAFQQGEKSRTDIRFGFGF